MKLKNRFKQEMKELNKLIFSMERVVNINRILGNINSNYERSLSDNEIKYKEKEMQLYEAHEKEINALNQKNEELIQLNTILEGRKK